MPFVENEYIVSEPKEHYTELENFKGLGPYVHEMCSKFANNIAQIDAAKGISQTFANMNSRCVQLAIELKLSGIQPGDIVMTCSYNSLDACVPIIGGIYVGAIISCLDPTLSLPTTTHLLSQVKPKILFCISDSVELIEKALEANDYNDITVVILDASETSNKYIPFSNYFETTRDYKRFKPHVPKTVKETVLVLFSSGTTGLAKGICLSHFGILHANFHWPMNYSHARASVTFATFYWVSALSSLFTACTRGCARIIASYKDADTALTLVEKYKVGFVVISTVILQHIRNINYGKYDLSHVQYVVIGGTPTTKEQLAHIFTIFPKAALLHSFGMTETSGCVSVFDSSNMDRDFLKSKLGSIGKLCKGFSCKVIDIDSGKPLGPNQNGELHLLTPYAMNGYYERDSSEAWDTEGWLRTGDVAYYDQDGFLYIVDRIKDMLTFRYWHVTPTALEAVLMQHPAVKEAVVIGLPHEVDGDLAMGIVVLNDCTESRRDASESDETCLRMGIEEELIKFVADRVGFRDRLHGGLKVVDSIPRTPSGKSRRRDLRIMVQEGKL